MELPLTTPREPAQQTFLYSEPVSDLDHLKADIAFLGIPFGDAYTFQEIVNDQTNMPAAMRQASNRIVRSLERYDFDLGGPLYDGKPIRSVDCGDVCADPADLKAHYRRAEAAVRKILAAGALPIVIGGDHGIPIPVLRALDREGPITLVQVDQHIDWRDDVNGVREGYSSPIRRASEMAHVGEIFQIGLRGDGQCADRGGRGGAEPTARISSRPTSSTNVGMEAILARIPDRRAILSDRRP